MPKGLRGLGKQLLRTLDERLGPAGYERTGHRREQRQGERAAVRTSPARTFLSLAIRVRHVQLLAFAKAGESQL
jgi:hypothetical protein